jgi:hypothetical protein
MHADEKGRGENTRISTLYSIWNRKPYIHFDPYLRRSEIEIVERERGKVKQGKAKQEGLG